VGIEVIKKKIGSAESDGMRIRGPVTFHFSRPLRVIESDGDHGVLVSSC